MDRTTYERWWSLHERLTRGVSLNAEEQTYYEAGVRQLQQEEHVNMDAQTLIHSRATVAALENELKQLRMRRETLDAEITTLDAALNVRTRELLDVKE